MSISDILAFAAAAVAVCGLAAVVWEVAVKNPRGILEMLSDVRDFAERPAPPPTVERGSATSVRKVGGRRPAR
jgi:hypothetical protein